MWCAYAAVLSVLPSALWRTLLGLGLPLGWSAERLRTLHIPGWGTAYVVLLSVLTVGAALLTLGLVQPWGERVPRWVPVLGGRPVPPGPVVAVALAGAGAVMWIGRMSVANWDRVSGFADRPRSPWADLMIACYAPGLLWGPLLVAVTVAYGRRRSAAGRW
ncbi:MAG: hypothetical protein M3P83_10980 [Actinomycetota bacterium]|nr:hypothetical protein [Actinomycetota bacterium]